MHEVACQLVSKWARLGPQDAIDPTDDFTRLTLDSIALCAMDIRFNSFYKDNLHPFVDAMKFFLLESGKRSARPSFLTDSIYRASTKQYWESIEVMKSTAMQAINERRQTPKDKVDLMNAMLYGKDPKTEQGMSETSIIQNAITFLIAGGYDPRIYFK